VFARSIVGELAGNLHTRKLRSAGFRVLKAPDVPSVLLEIGFHSNPDD
jgi:N-acetylmuramoyl-L-alanine amidase